jgi:hypothetical protein
MAAIVIALAILTGIYGKDIPEEYMHFDDVSYVIQTPRTEFKFSSQKTEDDDKKELFSYLPNVTSLTGISVSKDWLSLGFTIQTERNEDEIEETRVRGNTNFFDVQLMGRYQQFVGEIFYQNYHGFYLEDSNDTLLDSAPTVSTYSYGTNLRYFFNPEFNVGNSFNHFNHAKNTGWSTLAGLNANKFRLYSSSPLIPTNFDDNFSQISGLKSIEASSVGLEYGISGTKFYEKFYIGGMFSIGLALQEHFYEGIDLKSVIKTSTTNTLMLDGGYQLKHSLVGIEVRYQGINVEFANVNLTQSRTLGSMYYKYFF